MPGLVLLGHCTLHLVYHKIATPQPQNMLLPLSPWHKNLTMMSRFWRHFWPTHANCYASADRARPALLANAWPLAGVGQNGRQKTFTRAAMQGRWAPPLSLVQNMKIYFINNTHYFRTRFYITIKICFVWLACYFGGRHLRIGVMALSVMTQQRAIVDNAVRRPLSPSTCRRGALHPSATPPRSSLFSTLSSTAPARFWLVVVCKMIDQRLPKATMHFILLIF